MFNTSLNNALTRANSDLICEYNELNSATGVSLSVPADNQTLSLPYSGILTMQGKATNSAALLGFMQNISNLTWCSAGANNTFDIFMPVYKGNVLIRHLNCTVTSFKLFKLKGQK